MTEILSRLNGEELMVGTVVLGMLVFGIVIVVTKVVADAWVGLRERQLATSVILEMLDQRISADEIERLLKAAGFGNRGSWLSELREMRSSLLARGVSRSTGGEKAAAGPPG